jgi:hypothetical protein
VRAVLESYNRYFYYADGRFSFPQLQPGLYRVEADAPVFEHVQQSVTVRLGRVETVTLSPSIAQDQSSNRSSCGMRGPYCPREHDLRLLRAREDPTYTINGLRELPSLLMGFANSRGAMREEQTQNGFVLVQRS